MTDKGPTSIYQFSGDCGCFGKMNNVFGAGGAVTEGGQGAPIMTDPAGAGALDGCQGDAAGAIEMANFGLFFTDPSPMESNFNQGALATQQVNVQTQQGQDQASSQASAGGQANQAGSGNTFVPGQFN